MIKSFAGKDTEALFKRQRVARFQSIERSARRKLEILDAGSDLRDLSAGGNRLEKLEGNRSGQYSIRINDQWRICFRWQDLNAHDVEITDYH